MIKSELLMLSILVCFFMFLGVMGLQSTKTCVTMPDIEYSALKAQGKDISVGVVSETQNAITFYCSFVLTSKMFLLFA